MPEPVHFTTEDGVTIAGDWYPSDGGRFALLLHMMPATKESWEPFAGKLVAEGVSCLAVDLRGHGVSTNGGTLNYKTFSDGHHQASSHDVDAAFGYLQSRGATSETTILVGASIGANLAINFASQKGIPCTIALSPGLNYHGIKTTDGIRALAQGQRVVLVASDDDPESAESSALLHTFNQSRAPLVIRSGIGHGTRMFEADPGLMDELIAML